MENLKENIEKLYETTGVEKAIIKNNIHYLFKEAMQPLIPTLQNYFENKKIGPKTREKLVNMVKDHFKSQYGVNVGGWIETKEFYTGHRLTLTLYILTEEGFQSWLLEHNEEFEIEFDNNDYTGKKTEIRYYKDIKTYVPLANVEAEALALNVAKSETEAKIKELLEKQKELYKNFNDQLNGFEYEQLKLDYTLTLY